MHINQRGLGLVFTLAAALLMTGGMRASAVDDSAEANRILKMSGVKGGVVVHVGCGNGKLTAALRQNEGLVVQGLDTDYARVQSARQHIRSHGTYGKVSCIHWDGKSLPYADNLVNLLVVSEPARVSKDEIMRVLAPHGAVCMREGGRWVKKVKPWPESIDEWPQYLHGADNNGVAQDTVVGPPRYLQWTAEPSWSRSHMSIPTVTSMVSANGRLFTIEDRASVENPFLPGDWFLIARDAFNGTVLWRHALEDWEPVTRYVKDIAVQLQRRLVAVGNRVYCTPGLDAPVTVLDAGTGEVLRTYEETSRTQEFAYYGGVLYLVIGDRMNAARYNIVKPEPWRGMNLGGSDPEAPFGGTGWRSSYAPETPDEPDPVCSIVAMEVSSGDALWKVEGVHGYVGATLAVRAKHAVYQTTGGLTCLDRKNGKTVWKVEKEIKTQDGTSPNTVILSDDMVYAQEGKKLFAYDIANGAKKWTAPIANNYEKAADLFLADGAVWTGGSKSPTAYDPTTGEKLRQLKQRMTGPMGHDRCYRNFITEEFYINSKTGGADFVTLAGGKEFPHHWTRGTCGMGALPCNGLLYVGPYSCQCSIGVMAVGMKAYAAEPGLKSPNETIPVPREERLFKGEAYGEVKEPSVTATEEDWPTLRHDGTRGGATRSRVPADLSRIWETDLHATPSAPVIVKDRVFVAEGRVHGVCALDARDGSVLWRYTAGGRVDSPPTYYKGRLLFGCRDGWVYCLRASDGALVWRFKDLPDKMICAEGQPESVWPVCGSVLVQNDIAYFAAGRNSFLDGGIFVYGLNPCTGEVIHRRHVYGPFDEKTGFPAVPKRRGVGGLGRLAESVHNRGFKTDIPVTDGQQVYFRHKAFEADLSDADSPRPHVIPTAGFTGATPQHRTYWTVGTGYYGGSGIRMAQWGQPWGDILVTDGDRFYEVRGFPVKRHSYFDPRLKGYLMFAGSVRQEKQGKNKTKGREDAGRWSQHIPLTGEAMTLAGDMLFVAGRPAYFPPDHPVEKYRLSHAGKLGGVLWVASVEDGRELARYKLDSPPAWDGMAAAGGRLYLSLKDGRLRCMGNK